MRGARGPDWSLLPKEFFQVHEPDSHSVLFPLVIGDLFLLGPGWGAEGLQSIFPAQEGLSWLAQGLSSTQSSAHVVTIFLIKLCSRYYYSFHYTDEGSIETQRVSIYFLSHMLFKGKIGNFLRLC